MSKTSKKEADWSVERILTNIKDVKLMSVFLKDLLTPSELEEIKRRLKIIGLLKQGMPQREVAKKLKIAIATITRGARMLKNPNGGFNKLFK
ncbi:MAG: Trp family transcriptional regulator [Candidatus Komeilibacteria bacterium]|nr:Trp family transcriptional regulator [Candidatus Komeilibacteria bacterium]